MTDSKTCPLAFDRFAERHIGPAERDVASMLASIGLDSLEALADAVVPESIRRRVPLDLGAERTEHELLAELARMAAKNTVARSCIGMGYHDTITPPVILRNVLENPGWYTQYTPYQAEIAQGRLEALLNFQTMVADLTGLPLANSSMLDEGTSAAEAMSMCRAIAQPRHERPVFVADAAAHPQTLAVLDARAGSMGIELRVVDLAAIDPGSIDGLCGVLIQYPDTDGVLRDPRTLIASVKAAGALAVVAADPLALLLVESPGTLGADIAVGNTQRFGVPLGCGGPHAGYIATHETHARKMPGRLVGISRDAAGNPAYRLAIQTREQHIKRDRATSNICTAQVLLAITASMYAVYHGPDGLRHMAGRVHRLASALALLLARDGNELASEAFVDTLRVRPSIGADEVHAASAEHVINFRHYDDGTVGIALDETTTPRDVSDIAACFGVEVTADVVEALAVSSDGAIPEPLQRTTSYLEHPVFSSHHSETEMLRYITGLQRRDLSLADSMIPLGSCTMKLNATAEMIPVTWPGFGRIHPFAPEEQRAGYAELCETLEAWLVEITGLDAVSLQPNAGSQGEYAGLLTIRAWHESRGEGHRDVCLIPVSAHGTNPASAVIAGMRVVPVKCDDHGNIDPANLAARAAEHAGELAALMITYPSTHGVFEESVVDLCKVVHENGGQVYLDGANMNAQVGLCRPGEIGDDVVHLNLHKTFCIPHGGGGPGMGPIAVASHLAPFLPGHPVAPPANAGDQAISAIAAAPYGSPSILPISWAYIAMMGEAGLKRATLVAILNANYMAKRLSDHYDILFTGRSGLVAHEFIIDCRAFDKSAGIKIDDIAKRLMDYGFHAPTMAWPVPGTLMIEPTESEPTSELDRYCDALIGIRAEIAEIESGAADREDNVLKHAPHTIEAVTGDEWSHAYPREKAVYPVRWLRDHEFWPPVGRIDNPFGDRNLVCSCPPMTDEG